MFDPLRKNPIILRAIAGASLPAFAVAAYAWTQGMTAPAIALAVMGVSELVIVGLAMAGF